MYAEPLMASCIHSCVSISASEGIIAYLLAPALLQGSVGPLEWDRRTVRLDSFPSLTFVDDLRGKQADIALLTLPPGDLPTSRAALRVRHVGTMRFAVMAAYAYLDRKGAPASFEALAQYDVLDHARYADDPGLTPWNDLVTSMPDGPSLTVQSTSGIHFPLTTGCGIALLPTYAPLYDDNVTTIDIPVPDMRIELWLAAHEDSLREPAVRAVYDTVAEMFLRSPWFR
jgi:DNA-binding transcriptional LysR family regulator